MNEELMAQQGAGLAVFPLIIGLAVAVLVIAAMWKVFTKAGKPGWAAIVPIYNIVVMLEIAGKPVWWLVLYFIPVANLVATIVVNVGIARSFGKSVGFGLGLAFVSVIFVPILGFGSATYGGSPGQAPGEIAPAM